MPQVEDSPEPEEVDITTKKAFGEFTTLVQIANKIMTFAEYEESQKVQGKKLTLRNDICHLMRKLCAGDTGHGSFAAIQKLLCSECSVSPIFVFGKDCPYRTDEISKSKDNPRAIACMVVWFEDFVDTVKFPADRIVAITPYRSNLWHIHAELASSTLLKDVQSATIDSYQGRENDMVVLCLAVDKSTGPCFTAQPQRLNVATTHQPYAVNLVTSRHKLFMAIFGDIKTSQAVNKFKSIQATAEGGTKTQVRSDMSDALINWFKEKNRVAHVQGDPTIDPEEESHWGGDTSMANPATQEGTRDWGNPKSDDAAGSGEHESGGTAQAWPGPGPLVASW
ncbi:hypothetical protein FGADI_10162 [Fusarium gaditjirri]|uniref:DNA2/NAM7 helicase-like C-terminal domain-containing protein n=1 Tax=Fusarium gaditjirri TaxID=282569 RepID=A0A8H4SY75_9HYPO|nr:hypothetical protein FGADI_10162 [Fusarium gaditjirri]